MPSLGSHLASARVLAGRLGDRSVDAELDSFLLGSTAPDIRVITRLDRDVYHFFDLDDFDEQDSVARMFDEHPQLVAAAGLDAPTRSFVAGYLTHLVMDQDYVERIYRRHFGAATWGDDARGNVLDRVLQFELDRREREDESAWGEVRDVLAGATAVADVQFIAADTLGRWVEIVRDIVAHPATWDRFPQMMSHHLASAGYSETEIEEFCRDVPQILDETLTHINDAAIRDFFDETMDRALARVREYLQ